MGGHLCGAPPHVRRPAHPQTGLQGHCIYKQKGIEIWARPIMPVYRAKYSYAIVFLNRRTDGTPSEVSVTLKELGLDNPTGYHIEDLTTSMCTAWSPLTGGARWTSTPLE